MKHLTSLNALPLVASALMLLANTGCGRDDVKVYHVATNDTVVNPPGVPAPMAMPSGMVMPAGNSQPKIKYTLPTGWKEKTATQMRVASFEIAGDSKTADVSVIPLGAMSGGDGPNVNRWRGQIGLAALAEAEVLKTAEKVEIAGQAADLYDLAGTNPGSGNAQRILGAILHGDDAAWYFKVIGDSTLVENNKTAFVNFLKSVQFDKNAAFPTPSAMDMSQLPPSHPAIGGADAGGLPPSHPKVGSMGGIGAPVPPVDPADKPAWTIPAGWQEGPLAQFLIAKFIVKGDGEASAAINVSRLAGDGGGLLSNVNRWHQQLSIAAINGEELAKLPVLDVGGVKATLVDITGNSPLSKQPVRLVGVVLPLGGQTWFYKLMGDPTVVAQQKEALLQFVKSAKYPDAH